MSLKIDVNELINFTEKMQKELFELKNKSIPPTIRRGMNRAITSTKTDTRKLVHREIFSKRLKVKDINRRLLTNKARGNDISKMNVSLYGSTKEINMRSFISGKVESPKPKLKGVKVSQRKRLQAMVKPGVKVKLKRSFVFKANNSNDIVGVRRRGGKVIGHNLRSLGQRLKLPKYINAMGILFSDNLGKQLDQSLNFELNKHLLRATRRF